MCGTLSVEMTVGEVDEFVGIGKGEVAILEDVFTGGSVILSNLAVVNTGRELCSNVPLIFLELSLLVGVGPENRITIFFESGAPVTLHADPTPLPCCTLADSKLFPPTKLDQVIILCLDRLVVVNDGPKVDMSVAQDVMQSPWASRLRMAFFGSKLYTALSIRVLRSVLRSEQLPQGGSPPRAPQFQA